VIPLVTASEQGKAQALNPNNPAGTKKYSTYRSGKGRKNFLPTSNGDTLLGIVVLRRHPEEIKT